MFIILFLIYSAILISPALGINPDIVTILKYLAVLTCVLYSLFINNFFKGYYTSKELNLILAMILTAICDYFLLFTNHVHLALILFPIVHIFHAMRFNPDNRYKFIVFYCIIQLLAMSNVKRFNGDLEAQSLVYAYALVQALIWSYAGMKNSFYKERILSRLSMTLFLFCDINVLFFNVIELNSKWSNIFSYMIWVFYIPSLYLLAKSKNFFHKNMYIIDHN